MTHCFLPHRSHPRSNAHPEVPQNTAEVGTSKTGSTTDITPVLANKVHKKWKWQQHSLLVTELLPHCSQKNPVCLKHGRAGALGCAVARPRAHSSHSGSSAMSGHFWKAQGMGCGRRIGYKKKNKNICWHIGKIALGLLSALKGMEAARKMTLSQTPQQARAQLLHPSPRGQLINLAVSQRLIKGMFSPGKWLINRRVKVCCAQCRTELQERGKLIRSSGEPQSNAGLGVCLVSHSISSGK